MEYTIIIMMWSPRTFSKVFVATFLFNPEKLFPVAGKTLVFDWHEMVTKVTVPSASGITHAPPPDFCSILQNLRFGVFTLLPEYPLRYCRMTVKVRGGAHGGCGDYGLIGEETVEKPRRKKSKLTAGSKTGGRGRDMGTHPVQGGR